MTAEESTFSIFPKLSCLLTLIAIGVLVGCSHSYDHSVDIIENSPGSDSFSPLQRGTQQETPILFIRTIKIFEDGAEYGPGKKFLSEMINYFKKTNLFSAISFDKPSFLYYVELEVSATEEHNTEGNGAGDVMKGALVGLSFFLLSPVFPSHSDYTLDIEFKAYRWDGMEKRYHARTTGVLEAPLKYFDNLSKKIKELHEKVRSQTYNSLMSQMLLDVEFYSLPEEQGEEEPIEFLEK